MPFDGKNYETKPNVFSVEGLLAWLETQRGTKTYRYESVGDCLLCRYLNASGVKTDNVSATMGYVMGDSLKYHCPPAWGALNRIAADAGGSYASAADRCRAYLKARASRGNE